MSVRLKSFQDADIVLDGVANITALKALDTTDGSNFPDYCRIYVESTGEFYLNRNNSETESLPNIVAPTTGVGRWILVNGSNNNNILRRIINSVSSNEGTSFLGNLIYTDKIWKTGTTDVTYDITANSIGSPTLTQTSISIGGGLTLNGRDEVRVESNTGNALFFGNSITGGIKFPARGNSNTIGNDLPISSQQGTGNTTPSKIIFKTPTITTSGSTAQTLFDRMTINSDSVTIHNTTASTSGNTGALIVNGGIGAGGDIYSLSINTKTLSIFDTFTNIYRTAFDIAGSNHIRLGNGYGTITITPTTINLSGSSSINNSNGAYTFSHGVGFAGYTFNLQTSANSGVETFSITGATGNSFGNNSKRALRLNGTWTQTSGSGNFTGIEINYTINQSGGSSTGIFRGLHYNPTITSVNSHIAAELVSGVVILGDTTQSVNTTSGALVVAGGVGIGGILNVSSNVNISGSVNLGTSLSLLNTSDSSQKIALQSNLSNNTLSIGGGFGNLQTTGTSVFRLQNTGATILSIERSASAGANTNFTPLSLSSYNYTTTNSGTGIFTGVQLTPTISGSGSSDHLSMLVDINPSINITSNDSVYGLRSRINSGTGTRYNLYVDGTAPNYFGSSILISDSTSSANSTSGALQVVGGVGIGGSVNIGGNINVASGVLVTGSNRVTARSIWPDLSTRTLGDAAAIWNALNVNTINVYTASSINFDDGGLKSGLNVASTNNLRIGGGFTDLTTPATAFAFTGAAATIRTSTSGVSLGINTVGGVVAHNGVTISKTNSITSTSGNSRTLLVGGTFAPTSGSATHDFIITSGVVNQTGSTGIVTGLTISPTITSVSGVLMGIRSLINDNPAGGGTSWNIYIDGTAPNYFAGNVNIGGISSTAMINIATSSASKIGLILKGATSQSVDLLQVQDSNSNNLFKIDSVGDVIANGSITANNIFNQNGNSFGTNGVIGTNDNFSLVFETNNTTRWIIREDGRLQHSSANSNLTHTISTPNIGSETFSGTSITFGGNLTLTANNNIQLNRSIQFSSIANSISFTGLSGTNVGGSDLTISSQQGRGTGTPSKLIFQTPTVTVSGSGAQTMETRMSIDSSNALFTVPVTTNNDVEITDSTKGVILKSPNGTRWRVTIDDTGTIIRTSL